MTSREHAEAQERRTGRAREGEKKASGQEKAKCAKLLCAPRAKTKRTPAPFGAEFLESNDEPCIQRIK